MDEIIDITRDKERAEDLLIMARERLEILKLIPRDKAYKIIEEYYEILKEILTAIMYLDGKKTLSHTKLIEYFSMNYKDLDNQEIRLIDTLRRHRHGIVYYGKKISQDFLINHEKSIKKIIKKLLDLSKKKLKE